MTILSPMRPEAYGAYLQSAVAGYAEDNVAVGRWPSEGALERSLADFTESLPLGLATPKNHLYEIKASETGPVVGVLWFAEEEKLGLRSAYVYDVVVHDEFRRQGHALGAFKALEQIVSALALTHIGLHVFGHNPGAQALYAKLGYGVTGINMAKHLASPPA